jgi:putative membrane protein
MADQPEQQSLDLRDCLALERTSLANERTFFAYARTAIMVLITGVSAFKLFPGILIIFIAGLIAVGLSVILFFIGLKKYLRRYRSLSTMKSNCFLPN